MSSTREFLTLRSLSGRSITLADSGYKNTAANQTGYIRGLGCTSDGKIIAARPLGANGNYFLTIDVTAETVTPSINYANMQAGSHGVVQTASRIYDGITAGVKALNPATMAVDAGQSFSAASSAEVRGMGVYGSGFWTADAEGNVYIHDGPTFTEGSPPRFSYAWRDANVPGGFHETATGPLTSASAPLRSRARIQVTTAPFTPGVGVDSVTHARIYGGTGTYYAQADTAVPSVTLTTLATSGATPGSTAAFSAANPAVLRSQDGSSLLVGADGSIAATSLTVGGSTVQSIVDARIESMLIGAKLIKTTGQSYSADTWTKVTFNTQEYSDAPNFADTANSRLVIPAAGRYLVGAQLSHPTNYGAEHMRRAVVVKGDEAPSASNQLAMVGQRNPGTATADTAVLFLNMSTPSEFAAGDYVTLWWMSTAASNFGELSAAPFNLWAQKVK